MSSKQHSIILASESPFKKMLLERLQIPFSCIAPHIDEAIAKNEDPKLASERLARNKALAVAQHYKNKQHQDAQELLIIACDQVPYIHDGNTDPYLSKPGTLENAKRQLLRSSGNRVSFYTSLFMCTNDGSYQEHYTDLTKVHYRNLSEMEIDNYLSKEDVLGCAGSAKIEGLGISLLEKVTSDDPSALIGLPLIALSTRLKAFLNR